MAVRPRSEISCEIEAIQVIYKALKPARKAPAKTSPTQLSLKHMRELGYVCEVTERWNMYAKCRQDLYGFIDILCLGENEVVGVQATSYANVSNRKKKITEHENLAAVRKAGLRILVHGWHKVNGKWTVREVDLS